MMAQTGLAKAFGWLVGTTPGSGMSLQYLFSGLAYLAIIGVAWFIPTIRNVEELLPDHDQLDKAESSHQNGGQAMVDTEAAPAI